MLGHHNQSISLTVAVRDGLGTAESSQTVVWGGAKGGLLVPRFSSLVAPLDLRFWVDVINLLELIRIEVPELLLAHDEPSDWSQK